MITVYIYLVLQEEKGTTEDEMPGESPQRSLVNYSPWGQKELDMTEQISTAHIRSPNGDVE